MTEPMNDLLGDAIRESIPPEPFYCYGCSATHSARCKGCDSRLCGNKAAGCEFADCPDCNEEASHVE